MNDDTNDSRIDLEALREKMKIHKSRFGSPGIVTVLVVALVAVVLI